MRTGMVALALGLLVLRFLPALPPVWLIVAMLWVGLMALPFRTYPLAFFLFGLTWATVSAKGALEDRLPERFDGQTLWLEGTVVGLPSVAEGATRFQLDNLVSRRTPLPERIRVAWYDGPPVNSGERWRLAVKLKRPGGLANPDAFDYEAWLLAQRIGATGTVVDGTLLAATGTVWRDAIRQRLLAVDAQGHEGGLAALVLGDDSGLSAKDWQVLQDTGTVHLLVISGTHIGLLAGLLYGLVAGLARLGLWPRVIPWLPSACGLAFAGALVYGFLAGFGVPVQRACVMLGLVLIWRLRFRHLGVTWPLLIALNLLLLADPLISLRPGFWLSFTAVGILILIFAGRLGPWHGLHSWSRSQWLIAVGLLPVLLALNLPVSLSGPLVNLIAVPWVSLFILPMALFGTFFLAIPPLGETLLWLAGGSMEGLFRFLSYMAQALPAWTGPAVPVWVWPMSLLGAVLLLLPAGVPLRPLGWPMLLLCVFAPREVVPPGEVRVQQLDVGQGLAILLRTRDHALLYDAGPRFGEFDIGERVVLPALRRAGIGTLDVMLLSHADADHAGGAQAVKRALPVVRTLGGDIERMPPGLSVQRCNKGETWTWNGVTFSTWLWDQAAEGNQGSCVLRVDAAGERLLLTGDIDAQAEQALLDEGVDVRARWLQAPHHGSRTSSSKRFLQAVSPEGVLISRGRNNAFGHPHPLVMSRYRWLGIETHDSAERGAITLQLGAFGKAKAEREVRRFWRD
ncbi:MULTISPECIES: DNA internalization-related competence protein ComEC/Rec2 [unclassified Pseudomonas]|uniref:DNA internalization-related competence protein ComEC/Rec2 n=1 Tax=unclassified Pseudomonas TaxID=196821 RepID=UPI000D3863B7|nr:MULTISPECIES: DNA internalization-related competence protein ComEC/Rec2 [unclassified Pseudomonas]RAU47400.1 DNA internalization-related competence protein ComEC/Rec2 [Pseudomonas sp. RIT 409]RAU51925.1 DNA internalization-related competence protein ComEC/Rec2 [Pseudomonas sp. RIT 412]